MKNDMSLINILNKSISEEEYFQYHNIKVYHKDLPGNVYGFITRYRGINMIILNNSNSDKENKKTLIHEIAHFELGHLDEIKKNIKSDLLKKEVDEYIKKLSRLKK